MIDASISRTTIHGQNVGIPMEHNLILVCSFSRYPANQVSGPIKLNKGRVYFMQAFVKEGGGGDHVSVGVKLPNKKMERPIQNANLFIGPNGKPLALIADACSL